MKFQIGQDLFVERTLVVSMTIVLFGVFSIGILWLMRRASQASLQDNIFVRLKERAAGATAGIGDLVNEIEALARSARAVSDHIQQITHHIGDKPDKTR